MDYDIDNLVTLKEGAKNIVEQLQKQPDSLVVLFIPKTGTIVLINNEREILRFLSEHQRYANDYYLSMWCLRKYDSQEYHEQEKKILNSNARIRLIFNN